MKRRTMLYSMASAVGGVFAPGLIGTQAKAQYFAGELSDVNGPLAAPWAAWKAAFLHEDGRVVDELQQGASHSESQGYGLLLSAILGDNSAFDRIYRWTEANLAVRSDALLAWRFLPDSPDRVPDKNNASDGDLFYAWGLAVRGQRDGRPELLDRVSAIARDLVAKCLIRAPDRSGRLLLTPAAQGFDRGDGVIINPSYYMPLALRTIAQITGQADLATCATDGETLMSQLSGGGLIPDWIRIGPDGISTVEGMSSRNGYDALRVPLFLIWSGNPGHVAVTAEAQAYQRAVNSGRLSQGEYVTVFDRLSGSVIETSRHVGYGAVAAFVNCSVVTQFGAPIPFFQTVDQPYYPATLHLMTLISQIQTASTCEPI
ncbi:glycosyl hydrolase family 8 [Pseudooceanicola spongiae]|jgi:endoglucanase|uniref:cellulase n=1 Tax=Pseudooceanicola spongiae TaxID=2613965 RepID=A0A7L9WID2_9RHOB|nr:glycosyl hydrolase family 8 [Pseudooceanicola spongiae]QOL79574.1 glycosyl hydrolase family 5 [Pseudooceanicola spongiae]